MKKILYIHGFGSDSNAIKGKLLKNFFSDELVFTPTLPDFPNNAISFLENTLYSGIYSLIVASSLGGFYALQLNKKFNIPTILINPSLEPQKTIGKFLGTSQEFSNGKIFTITQEYIDELSMLRKSINYKSLHQRNLYFFLSLDDEVLNHTDIPNIFPNAAEIKFFSNSTHAFLNFEDILPEIEAIFETNKNLK